MSDFRHYNPVRGSRLPPLRLTGILFWRRYHCLCGEKFSSVGQANTHFMIAYEAERNADLERALDKATA